MQSERNAKKAAFMAPFLSLLASCATPFALEKPFDLGEFSAVDVSWAMTCTVTRGDSFSVLGNVDKAFEGALIVERKGSTLYIKRKQIGYLARTMTVAVTMPRLESLTLNGASKATVSGFSDPQGKLRIDLNGASSLDFTGGAFDNLEIRQNGASRAYYRGSSASSADIGLNGGSKAYFIGFAASSMKLDLNGASRLEGEPGSAVNGPLSLSANGASSLAFDLGGKVDGFLDGASKLAYGLSPDLSGLSIRGGSSCKARK